MNLRSKFFLFIITSISIVTAKPSHPVEEVTIENLLGEDDDPLNIDVTTLRSFDDPIIEETPIPLKEKIEMLFIILRSKTRGYKGGLIAHLEQHSNEYLLGSACIVTMLLAALLKNYTSKSRTSSC